MIHSSVSLWHAYLVIMISGCVAACSSKFIWSGKCMILISSIWNSYHLQCLRPTEVDRNHADAYICPYCQYFESESVSQFGGSPLVWQFPSVTPIIFWSNSYQNLILFLLVHRDLEGSALIWECWLSFSQILNVFAEGKLLCVCFSC